MGRYQEPLPFIMHDPYQRASQSTHGGRMEMNLRLLHADQFGVGLKALGEKEHHLVDTEALIHQLCCHTSPLVRRIEREDSRARLHIDPKIMADDVLQVDAYLGDEVLVVRQ